MSNLPPLRTVKNRVRWVLESRDDPERAAAYERELWRDVLRDIVADPYAGIGARARATEALRTLEIHFPRWHAG